MKHMKRTLSLLLTLCMLLGCMAVGVMAADPVVTTARGSAGNAIPVYSNQADNSRGSVTLDAGTTVSDDGVLTFYDYGTVTSTVFQYLTAKSNNEKVATVVASYEGGTLKLAFTGVADGVATVTVDYTCTTHGGSDSLYGEHSGAATGKLYYTVKVGTGSSTPVTPDQPGGDGELKKDTEGRYVIYNQTDLEAVANEMGASYIVANDITLTGSWTPLGWTDSEDVPFTGTLDGNGYTISGLGMDYEGGSYVGLFAINNGTIKDLTVSGNAYGAQYVGLLCGQNGEQGTILNCTATGTQVAGTIGIYETNSEIAVGGLVGRNDGSIAHSYAEVGNVKGRNYIGGLVGQNYGKISECYAEGDVNNDYIPNYSTGRAYAGGLVGGNVGSIENSYVNLYLNRHVVRAYNYAGGLIGNSFSGTVSHSYADGLGHGDNQTGVIGGSNGGIFMGANNATVTDSYTISKNTGTSAGATRVAYTDWQNSEWTAANTAFDFDNVWTYVADVNDNYPVLRNCGNSGEHENIVIPGDTTTFTVTFVGGGLEGDKVTDLAESYNVASGTEINLPAAPVRTNDQNWVYDFKGWSDGENTYDVGAAYTVTGDVTFNATWKLHSVNGDGEWTYLDAMAIMDYLAGNITLTAEQIEAADYNHDGTVSYLDAMRIMDVLAGNG